jgi:tetratricopeptide (TPR) repeat protein
MIRQTPGIFAATLILFWAPPCFAAQSPTTSETSPAGASQHLRDTEREAISTATREGRLLDAEKLLKTAIEREELKSPPSQRLRQLFSQMATVESRLSKQPKAVEAAQRVLEIDRAQSTTDSRQIMFDLRKLLQYAKLGRDQGVALRAAEDLLALARENPGPGESQLAGTLSLVAFIYEGAHRTAESQALRDESIQICEGQTNLNMSPCASILAQHYRKAGRADAAETLLLRQAEETPDSGGKGQASFKVATLVDLAGQYQQAHSYDKAADTYQKAIAVNEAEGKDPLGLPTLYDRLGTALEYGGRNEEAEAAFQHAFDLRAHATGPDRSYAIATFSPIGLVQFYQMQGRIPEAEAVLKRILALQEQALNPQGGQLIDTLLALADVEWVEGKYSEVEDLMTRALKIGEAAYGTNSPLLVRTLVSYSKFARQMGDMDKADALDARVRRLIPDPANQPNDIKSHDGWLIGTLSRFAELKFSEGEYSEVEELLRRAMEYQEANDGPDSPRLISTLQLYSQFARQMGDTAKADALAARADSLRPQPRR